MMPLGRVGLWTRQLDSQPAAAAIEAAVSVEALGYPTLWIPEAVEREVLSHATMLLGATSELVVATGIARVHAGRLKRPHSPNSCLPSGTPTASSSGWA